MEMEEKYTIAEDYELPSEGLIYETHINPHVKLRSMTTREEMRRLNKTSTPYKTLSEIIEACMIEKPAVHVYDMALGDYEYLLHKLRTVSHSPKYKMDLICPYCGKYQEVVVDLDKIEKIPFDEEEWRKSLTLTLPKTGKEVTLKYQTPRMLDTIAAKVNEMEEQSKDNTGDDFGFFITIMESIDLVDGVKLNYVEKENFVYKLPVADAKAIEARINAINSKVGIDNKIECKCKNTKCGRDILTFFRYGPEFFGPTND